MEILRDLRFWSTFLEADPKQLPISHLCPTRPNRLKCIRTGHHILEPQSRNNARTEHHNGERLCRCTVPCIENPGYDFRNGNWMGEATWPIANKGPGPVYPSYLLDQIRNKLAAEEQHDPEVQQEQEEQAQQVEQRVEQQTDMLLMNRPVGENYCIQCSEKFPSHRDRYCHLRDWHGGEEVKEPDTMLVLGTPVPMRRSVKKCDGCIIFNTACNFGEHSACTDRGIVCQYTPGCVIDLRRGWERARSEGQGSKHI